MEEKKQVKISLGTAICIFIIILLVIALAGTIIYYNSNNEKENIAEEKVIERIEENEKVEEQDEILEDIEKEYKNEIEEDDIIVEEIYAYSNSNETEAWVMQLQKIGFSSNGEFLIKTSMFDVTGKYELTDNNIKKCKIEKYFFYEPNGRKTISLEDDHWFIDFEKLENEKLKVVSNNINGESEIAISLSQEFYEGAEFIKYNLKDFVGTWTSSYAYKLENSGYNHYYTEVDLANLLGSAIHSIRK